MQTNFSSSSRMAAILMLAAATLMGGNASARDRSADPRDQYLDHVVGADDVQLLNEFGIRAVTSQKVAARPDAKTRSHTLNPELATSSSGETAVVFRSMPTSFNKAN